MPAGPFLHSFIHYLMLSRQSVTQSYTSLFLRLLLQSLDKAHERFSSLFGAFIDTCVFQYMNKHLTDLLLQDLFDVVRIDFFVFWKEFLYPVRMFFDLSLLLMSFPSRMYSFRSSISSFRRAGRTASPITSIRPMFSFLIWWYCACGW